MDEEARVRELIQQIKDLRVRETSLLQELEDINSRRRQQANGEPTPVYRIGDRVYVTNRIRRPVLAPRDWTCERERHATVTAVDRTRVHFRTDNGTETWRSHKNLRPLQP